MKVQALILLAGTEQVAASSFSNLDPEVVQCSSTTGTDSIENEICKTGIIGPFTSRHGQLLTPNGYRCKVKFRGQGQGNNVMNARRPMGSNHG